MILCLIPRNLNNALCRTIATAIIRQLYHLQHHIVLAIITLDTHVTINQVRILLLITLTSQHLHSLSINHLDQSEISIVLCQPIRD